MFKAIMKLCKRFFLYEINGNIQTKTAELIYTFGGLPSLRPDSKLYIIVAS